MNKFLGRAFGWLVLLLIGAALALGVGFLTHLVHVSPTALLTTGGVLIGLAWLAGLVTLPWNLYFAAHRALAGMKLSRERGITVRDADEAEASRLARRMLGFAIGAHVATALAAAVVADLLSAHAGYYVAGFFLITTAFRPAAAYFAHVRARIGALQKQSMHPRDDVATLVRRIEAALDGIGDHQELLAGLRALVRMVRSEPAWPEAAVRTRGIRRRTTAQGKADPARPG